MKTRSLLLILPAFLLTACHNKLGFADISKLHDLQNRLSIVEADQQNLKLALDSNSSLTIQKLESLQNDLKEANRNITKISANTQNATNQDSSKNQEPTTQNGYKYLENKLIIGAVEKVKLEPNGLVFDARIDSGASTSSIDSKDILYFERDGKRWVKFAIDSKSADQVELELPIKRMVKILQSSSEESDRRAVVELSLTIGDISQIVEFTLTDRSHLEFPLLVGRNALKDLMIVDVSKEYTLE